MVADAPLPLAGIRVLDLSRALAGPLCSMLLGDLGSDVIKIENPTGGDETRAWGPPYAGTESGYYLAANRNKRSVTVNIRAPRGAELVRRLAMHCDVLIENFSPGVTDRYYLDAKTLRRNNERLVYCTISSFQPATSSEQVPGYDFVIQAMSGLMSITGSPDGDPQKVGVAIVDVLSGLFAANAIQAALIERQRTGCGSEVGVSLMDAALASLVNVASNYLLTGQRPARWGNAHANLAPYQSFQTLDGTIAIGVGNDAQFERLCAILGRSDLVEDGRFSDNSGRVAHRDELLPQLQMAFIRCTTEDWLVQLQRARIPAAPINHVDEAFSDSYVTEAGMIDRVVHPSLGAIPLVASPLRFNDRRVETRSHPPLLGEHTVEVLREMLDIEAEEIEQLRAEGAI